MTKDISKTNLVVVINKNFNKVLMCLRKNNPYKGQFNFVGGKIKKGEESFESAYRELLEETGIKKDKITLCHLMNIDYIIRKLKLEVYCGILIEDVVLIEEVNPLYWIDINEDFFDLKKFAGEGNIGLIIEQVLLHKKQLQMSIPGSFLSPDWL